jgi:anti-anti-sigma factor
MFERTRIRADRTVSPPQHLVGGGGAEEFERELQHLLRGGRTEVLVDLSAVESLDSAGLRALVRAHTTAQRMGGTLRLAAAPPAVTRVFALANLDTVFSSYESVSAARVAAWPWRTIATIGAGIVLCALLAWAGLRWDAVLAGRDPEATAPLTITETAAAPRWQPFIELAKLVAALLIGMLVTTVHRPSSRDRLVARAMAHAQMLLCVAGALMMIVIGNSLARAFGVVGAASIVRFRTPVDDPKDVTILFILMGLGMAAGLGSFAVAGLGTAFLCIALLALDRMHRDELRMMTVEVVADGRNFPTTQIEDVFARSRVVFEPREVTQGDEVAIKYNTWLDRWTSIEELSARMRDVPGVTEVVWQYAKRA